MDSTLFRVPQYQTFSIFTYTSPSVYKLLESPAFCSSCSLSNNNQQLLLFLQMNLFTCVATLWATAAVAQAEYSSPLFLPSRKSFSLFLPATTPHISTTIANPQFLQLLEAA